MFTEKEIAIIVADNNKNYSNLVQAYRDLQAFEGVVGKPAPITFNAIRVANGFDPSDEFTTLIDGTTPTPPIPDDYRANRHDIRYNNWGDDKIPEETRELELQKTYQELGFHGPGWQQERAEDNPNK